MKNDRDRYAAHDAPPRETEAAPPALTCRDLAVGYGGRTVAQGISLTVRTGDCLCIIGENGCGKSTLLKTLLWTLPPLGGQLTWSPTVRAGGIGYLPQQGPAQRDFPASVREVVRSGCLGRCGPFYPRPERDRAAAAMDRMGIAALAKRCYRTLSGGQQQRVLLARALCAARQILVLDEPVAGLDPQATAELYALIASLTERDGRTVLMVSHDLDAALPLATHVLRLGAAPFFGTAQAYRESRGGAAS